MYNVFHLCYFFNRFSLPEIDDCLYSYFYICTCSGLAAAETILNTMRAAHVNISNDTRLSILKGVLRHSNYIDFERAVRIYGFKLNEYQLLDIINELDSNNVNFLSSVSRKYVHIYVDILYFSYFRLTHSMIKLLFQKNSETF